MTIQKNKGLIAIAAVLVLAAGGFAAYLWLSPEDDGTEVPGSTEDAAEPGEVPAVYYLEGNSLKLIAPGDDEGEVVREGISPVATAPDEVSHATWVAFSGSNPSVQIYDVAADEVTAVDGTTPVWSADGSRLAVLQGADGTPCDEFECDGSARVMVVDLDDGSTASRGEEGKWNLVGWAGDSVAVADAERKGSTILVGPGGEEHEVRLPAGEIKSISPDGRWVVTQPQQGPELHELSDDFKTSFVTSLGGPDETYSIIDWTSDSSSAVAVVNVEGATPKVVTFVPESDPSPEDFGTHEVAGRVLFTPDEKGLILTIVDRDETQLVASYCPLTGPETCEPLLSWQTGIRVLGVAAPGLEPGGEENEPTTGPTVEPDADDATPSPPEDEVTATPAEDPEETMASPSP